MEFVRAHTTIPVPRPILALICPQGSWIIMSRIRGVPLTSAWHELSEEKQAHVVHQLKGFLVQLRAVRSPFGAGIGTVDGGPLNDERLIQHGQCGCFRDARGVEEQIGYEMPAGKNGAGDRVVLTHCDFTPDNIMVDPGTGQITGLLDWEQSGWLPYWREMIKARMPLYIYPSTFESWSKHLPDIIGGEYREELAEEMRVYRDNGIPNHALDQAGLTRLGSVDYKKATGVRCWIICMNST